MNENMELLNRAPGPSPTRRHAPSAQSTLGIARQLLCTCRLHLLCSWGESVCSDSRSGGFALFLVLLPEAEMPSPCPKPALRNQRRASGVQSGARDVMVFGLGWTGGVFPGWKPLLTVLSSHFPRELQPKQPLCAPWVGQPSKGSWQGMQLLGR